MLQMVRGGSMGLRPIFDCIIDIDINRQGQGNRRLGLRVRGRAESVRAYNVSKGSRQGRSEGRPLRGVIASISQTPYVIFDTV